MPIHVSFLADDYVRVQLFDGAPGQGAELCEDLDLRTRRDAQLFVWLVEPFLPHLERGLRRSLMRVALRTLRETAPAEGEEVSP